MPAPGFPAPRNGAAWRARLGRLSPGDRLWPGRPGWTALLPAQRCHTENSAGSWCWLLSMQNRAGDGVAGHVQDLDTGDGLHGLVIGKGPDHALVPRYLDEVGGLAQLAVSQPVAHDRVAVGQPVEAGHELQADAGQLLAANLPDGSPIRRDFEHARGSAVAVGAGDQGAAVRQAQRAVGAARRR